MKVRQSRENVLSAYIYALDTFMVDIFDLNRFMHAVRSEEVQNQSRPFKVEVYGEIGFEAVFCFQEEFLLELYKHSLGIFPYLTQNIKSEKIYYNIAGLVLHKMKEILECNVDRFNLRLPAKKSFTYFNKCDMSCNYVKNTRPVLFTGIILQSIL